MFRNVQLILKGKKPIAAPYQRNRAELPLRRFLRCAQCEGPMTGAPSKSKTGKQHWYYRCYRCQGAESIPSDRAATEFVNLLAKLRVNGAFTTEFTTILREEWNKTTGASATLLPRLQEQLKAKRASQEKLLVRYLDEDKNIVPLFEQMNAKFAEEIATLEGQIAEANTEKATFEQLLEFSKSMLVDIATAWERADLDQKQRVQNALFPRGLKYDPERGILNSDNECLFNQLESFVSGKLTLVRQIGIERTQSPAPTYRIRAGRTLNNPLELRGRHSKED